MMLGGGPFFTKTTASLPKMSNIDGPISSRSEPIFCRPRTPAN